MIIDSLTEFADAVSVANAAGIDNVGNQIDLQTVRDIGNGQTVYVVITVSTAIITGADPGTISFQLVSDDSASIATDAGTQTVHFSTDTYVTDDAANNDLDVGAVVGVFALPASQFHAYEQYLGIQTTIATETVTAGAVNAFLTLDPYGWVPTTGVSGG